ncbi:MAG: gfo/Idh/MocA family oxidoreductase, partial [Ignavibacteriaceae bacterium]
PIDQNVEPGFISFGEIGVGNKRKRLVYEQPKQIETNALKYELQLFIESILKNEVPKVSGMDGLRALKVAKIIIDKIENSVYEFN